MAKVAGIGGVFLYAKDPSGLAAWYAQHLRIEFRQDEGTEFYYLVFRYRDFDHVARLLDTTLAIFPAREPLGDTRSEYKINYRMDDLEGMVAQLHASGIETSDSVVQRDEYGYGKFVQLSDPEGNQIELYQPIR